MNELIAQPVASSEIAQRLQEWASRGLKVVDVSERDVTQHVGIRHNALTGHMEVELQRLDGVQALGVLAEAMAAIYRDTFKVPLRGAISSGHSMVAVSLDGDTLRVVFGTHDPNRQEECAVADVPVAKGLLASALFGLCEGEFDPLEALTGIVLREGA